jgi:hypothetical protein
MTTTSAEVGRVKYRELAVAIRGGLGPSAM